MAIKGIKFGINAIQAGQKSSLLNATPQLIVKSTPGQFTITSPVSKALAIAVGENVMFLNNLAGIEAMIQAAPDELINYCNEHGWDINTVEGKDALIKDQLTYYVAKGVLMYKRNGEPILGTVRITKEDKAAYIAEHGVELIQNLSEEEKAKFAASKGLDGADDETLAGALTPDDVPSRPDLQLHQPRDRCHPGRRDEIEYCSVRALLNVITSGRNFLPAGRHIQPHQSHLVDDAAEVVPGRDRNALCR